MSENLTSIREMSGILLKVREVSGEKSCQFFETDCQAATVAMETIQLVQSQFKNFLTQ